MTISTHRAMLAKNIPVVFEDDSLLVLSKPGGMLVLPDRYDHSLPNLYHLCMKEYGHIFIVHRIDRDTSGIILLAKTSDAHAILNAGFQRRAVRKTYRAICRGTPSRKEGTIDAPLIESERRRGIIEVDRKRGKPSVTHYRILERFNGFALVEAKPVTGRTHQVRVHLREIGLPLIGDPLYGDGGSFWLSSIKRNYRSKENERPFINRTALHASSLSFVHPSTNQLMTLSVPLPKDMEAILKALRKYSPAPIQSQES